VERLAFRVIIPARMRSTRLPGKVLADVGGQPLVAWVVDRAKASGASAVVVATDHEDIAKALAPFGCRVLLTSPEHSTGTDRIAEAVNQLGLDDRDIVVNLQGDEPLIDPGLIRGVASTLAQHPEAAIATAAHPIASATEFFDPNVVKVVIGDSGFAQYFSRAPIPYARDDFARSRDALPPGLPAYRHIGLYAYRASFLRAYASLEPAPAERFEALEQLRALAHGYRIVVTLWPHAMAPGVDTPEDLERVRRQL